MSYLHFDKTLMTNLEDSLPKEVIRTNRSGAYSCSSVLGCNTSKYHGLLVTPVKEIDDDNHVLLSSLDETVIQHGAEFNLAIHKYLGGTFSPNGHTDLFRVCCGIRCGGAGVSRRNITRYRQIYRSFSAAFTRRA